ncbi:radical SAM protein [Streptococcus dysgalactiae subsp. equisimilis]
MRRISVLYNKATQSGVLKDRLTGKKYFINKIFYFEFKKFIMGDSKIDSRVVEFVSKVQIHQNEISLREFETKIPLKHIQIELTTSCNLRCKHCYLENSVLKKEFLAFDYIKKIIEEGLELGLETVSITGGECLLHPEINKIVEYISSKDVDLIVFTNGTILTRKLLDTLKQNVKLVRVSIDGGNSTTHDNIRGRGNFNKTLKNISKLLDSEIKVDINAVVSRNNLNEITRMLDLFKSRDVTFHFDRYIPNSNSDILSISDEEYYEALKNVIGQNKININHELTQSKERYCGAGISYVYIRNDGNVAFCPTVPVNFIGGNIKLNTLKNIWEESKFFKKKRFQTCKFYDICPGNFLCGGGCRSRSLYMYGGFNEPDKQMCLIVSSMIGKDVPEL